MNYVHAFLVSFLAFACSVLNANTFFIANATGYEVVVEFWRNGTKEEWFRLPSNYRADVTCLKGFDLSPGEYALKFTYLSDNKVVHLLPQPFLVDALMGKNITLCRPGENFDISQATQDMIDASERNMEFSGFVDTPFWYSMSRIIATGQSPH